MNGQMVGLVLHCAYIAALRSESAMSESFLWQKDYRWGSFNSAGLSKYVIRREDECFFLYDGQLDLRRMIFC